MAKKKESTCQYGVQKQQLNNLSKDEYLALRNLAHLNKNMYNVALYNIRQHFFNTGKYLTYNSNYHICKHNENYKTLNKNSAQQTIKQVHSDFSSLFALIEQKKKGLYKEKVRIPHYLDKEGFFTLFFSEFMIKDDYFLLPMSPEFKKQFGAIKIKVPRNLKEKTIKEVRIISKYNARFFELQWVYEMSLAKDNKPNQNVLAIDLGLDNLLTCVTNSGDSFIIDGKALKSMNQWANKEHARLQSIKDLQKINVETTKKQAKLWNKRNNQINDYLNKAVKEVISYCKTNDIKTIVLGYNKDMQRNSNMGKVNNQNFVNIPIAKIKEKFEYTCLWNGIKLILQEESYTSKADFLASDLIPTYGEYKNITYLFSGIRIPRGSYKSTTGICINADVNGALNILRKANLCNISLVHNAYLSPKRIFIVKLKNKKRNKFKTKRIKKNKHKCNPKAALIELTA